MKQDGKQGTQGMPAPRVTSQNTSPADLEAFLFAKRKAPAPPTPPTPPPPTPPSAAAPAAPPPPQQGAPISEPVQDVGMAMQKVGTGTYSRQMNDSSVDGLDDIDSFVDDILGHSDWR